MTKSKKTGMSMNGKIEYTRTLETKKFIRKKDNIKKKNAKVCLDCSDNKEGFCEKYRAWCSKVNYRCNGYNMSYDEVLRLQREKRKIAKKSIIKSLIIKKLKKRKKEK